MYDASRVLPGLALFVLAVTWPLWSRTLGSVPPAVQTPQGPCLLPTSDMRTRHPLLLARWRDQVVREGQRIPDQSLSRCLECHTDPGAFCEACHASVGVTTDCLQCHRGAP